MAYTANELLTSLLRDVSRTFYLTLRVLPRAVRPQIGLAYLLARMTDTVADTELLPLEQRLLALQRLRDRIQGKSSAPVDFGEFARQQASPSERALLEKVEPALALLDTLSPADRAHVRKVLDTITSGQELDLKRFHGASAKNIIALRTDAELDDYTYRVAGCVGEFWTEMIEINVFSVTELDRMKFAEPAFTQLGVRFGKGLQLVNILRDLPADLQKGRCYLPAEKLAELGLKPEDLLRSENEPKLRPLYDHYLDVAEANLWAGWTYTNTMAWTRVNLRLACAWPIMIGMQTISRLRSENVLDPARRVKITRAGVRGIMVRSVLCYPLPFAWKKLVREPISRPGKNVASGVNLP